MSSKARNFRKMLDCMLREERVTAPLGVDDKSLRRILRKAQLAPNRRNLRAMRKAVHASGRGFKLLEKNRAAGKRAIDPRSITQRNRQCARKGRRNFRQAERQRYTKAAALSSI